jgi:hypothetical protein
LHQPHFINPQVEELLLQDKSMAHHHKASLFHCVPHPDKPTMHTKLTTASAALAALLALTVLVMAATPAQGSGYTRDWEAKGSQPSLTSSTS